MWTVSGETAGGRPRPGGSRLPSFSGVWRLGSVGPSLRRADIVVQFVPMEEKSAAFCL